MLMTTGMTYAGALAASVATVGANPDGTVTVLLSDRLPSLYVRFTAPSQDVSQPVDRAIRAAHRRSVTVVKLI